MSTFFITVTKITKTLLRREDVYSFRYTVLDWVTPLEDVLSSQQLEDLLVEPWRESKDTSCFIWSLLAKPHDSIMGRLPNSLIQSDLLP